MTAIKKSRVFSLKFCVGMPADLHRGLSPLPNQYYCYRSELDAWLLKNNLVVNYGQVSRFVGENDEILVAELIDAETGGNGIY